MIKRSYRKFIKNYAGRSKYAKEGFRFHIIKRFIHAKSIVLVENRRTLRSC